MVAAKKPKAKPKAKPKTVRKNNIVQSLKRLGVKSRVGKAPTTRHHVNNVAVTKRPTNTRRIRPLPQSGAEPKFSWEPWGSSGRVHDNCYDYAFGSFSSKRTAKSVPGNRSGVGANGLSFTTCKGITQRILSDNPKGSVKIIKPTARCPPGFYKVMCFVAPHNDFGNSTGDFHFLKQVGSVRYKIRPNDTVHGIAKFFHVHPAVVLRAAKISTVPITANDGDIVNENSELANLDKLNVKFRNTIRLIPGRIIEFPVNLWAHKQGWAGGPLMIDASGRTIVDPRKANLNYHPGFHYTKFCSAWAVHRGIAETGSNGNR